jgi:diguanylate cyclase (GGDEF)-like protein
VTARSTRSTAPPRTPQASAPRGRAALAPTAWLLAALALVVCVGLADFLTGTDISLMLFYLAPIAFGTWYVSVRGGLFLAAAAALVSTAGDALYRLGGGEGELPLSVLAWNGIVQLGTSVALVLMLAALRARLEAEELLARTDALTGIANRRAFLEAAELELERARRHGRPLTVAYVDCDDLKRLNDRRGHAAGDALLVVAARTLRATTRAVDRVARLGGDEFGLLLPETDAAEAEALLSRLRSALLAAAARNASGVGFSVGGATFVSAPASVEELLARADELMYAAKREGKGALRLGVFPGAARPGGDAGGAHLTS